jgi:hypothetical protein
VVWCNHPADDGYVYLRSKYALGDAQIQMNLTWYRFNASRPSSPRSKGGAGRELVVRGGLSGVSGIA